MRLIRSGSNKAAGIALKLATPRELIFIGDVKGNGSFDGSQDVTITLTLDDLIINSILNRLELFTDKDLVIQGNVAKLTYKPIGDIVNNIALVFVTENNQLFVYEYYGVQVIFDGINYLVKFEDNDILPPNGLCTVSYLYEKN